MNIKYRQTWMRKFLKIVTFIYALEMSIPIYPVGAVEKTFEGVGYYVIDQRFEEDGRSFSLEQVKDAAIKNAAEHAGIYFESESKSSFGKLSNDVLSVLLANTIQVVGDPIIKREVIEGKVHYQCTLTVSVDTDNIIDKLQSDSETLTRTVEENKSYETQAVILQRELKTLQDNYNDLVTQNEKAEAMALVKHKQMMIKANEWRNQGDKLLFNHQFVEAIAAYRNALAINTNLLINIGNWVYV